MVGVTPVLDVANLCVSYPTRGKPVTAVRNASFHVAENEVFGLVGESGSGKSTLCMAILRLLSPQVQCTADHLMLGDVDLLRIDPRRLREQRWTTLSYIPQGSMGVLNPVARIRSQFLDVIHDHATGARRRELEAGIDQVLAGVNLPVSVLDQFPHELSGGMKQRVCIALSILLGPRLIIADEPTSALDVVSQRVVLETLSRVRRRLGASMVMIGHDMALQAQIADRIGIMFAGRFVEIGPTRRIFEQPAHPYTQRLIAAIPSIRKRQDIRELARRGLVSADEAAQSTLPEAALREIGPNHFAAI
jgi:ABC-type dipeptide/oligopeptide/nickel transport system ATPase component